MDRCGLELFLVRTRREGICNPPNLSRHGPTRHNVHEKPEQVEHPVFEKTEIASIHTGASMVTPHPRNSDDSRRIPITLMYFDLGPGCTTHGYRNRGTHAREHRKQHDPDADRQAEKRFPCTLRFLIRSRVGRWLSSPAQCSSQVER